MLEKKQRVVVVGMSANTPIGNNLDIIKIALEEGHTGISHIQEMQNLQFRSHVGGKPMITQKSSLELIVTKKQQKSLNQSGMMAVESVSKLLTNIKKDKFILSDAAIFAGTGGTCPQTVYDVGKTLYERGAKKVSPFTVPQVMGSTLSANITMIFGGNYAIDMSSACATGTQVLGEAFLNIRSGRFKKALVIAADDFDMVQAVGFDAARALVNSSNEDSTKASQPFSQNANGFVFAGGSAAILVMSLEEAEKEGLTPLVEIEGYDFRCGGSDMTNPSIDLESFCMNEAWNMSEQKKIDFINPHGTSTKNGDPAEALAITKVFGNGTFLTPTKQLTGHMLGATGLAEFIFASLSVLHNFFPNIPVNNPIPEAEYIRFPFNAGNDFYLERFMSSNFGFGGVYASIIASKFTS